MFYKYCVWFFATSTVRVLNLHTWVLPHTPSDGMARIFPLTPMLRPGIKLTLAQLHLLEGP